MATTDTLDFAESMIRETVSRSGLPVSRLLHIARDVAGRHSEPEDSWELAALEGEPAKPLIEARSGAFFDTAGVAARLKVSDQTVRNKAARGGLIACEPAHGRGLRFPVWQFTRGDVRAWVRPLIEAYGGNGWGLLDFLTVPRDPLDGENFLALLRADDPAPVLNAARRANRD